MSFLGIGETEIRAKPSFLGQSFIHIQNEVGISSGQGLSTLSKFFWKYFFANTTTTVIDFNYCFGILGQVLGVFAKCKFE